MKYVVTKKDRVLKGEVMLDGSKSITNRVLIIKALCDQFFELKNYSHSDDSNTLFNLINSDEKVLNAKDGGTTFRFLLAFLAVHEGEVILTGSERLIDRPIGPLVDALTMLGADIQYLGKQGYPPVLIRGKMLKDNKVTIESNMSSQFISALLLIAPILKHGLILKMKGEVVSRPYIQMTLDILKYFGIRYEWSQNIIGIARQEFSARDFKVEGDWSAASYFYQMAALCDEVDLKLNGLNRISLQGDAVIAQIMEQFGVTTTFAENGVRLTRSSYRPKSFKYDFTDCPDLAQTMIACCSGLNIPAQISGISNLQIKETNRIAAMQNELTKLGLGFAKDGEQWLLGTNPGLELPLGESPCFDTYNDHRMAMSLAPFAIPYQKVVVNDPLVVAKSFPGYWDSLKGLGFEIEEVTN